MAQSICGKWLCGCGIFQKRCKRESLSRWYKEVLIVRTRKIRSFLWSMMTALLYVNWVFDAFSRQGEIVQERNDFFQSFDSLRFQKSIFLQKFTLNCFTGNLIINVRSLLSPWKLPKSCLLALAVRKSCVKNYLTFLVILKQLSDVLNLEPIDQHASHKMDEMA